MEFGASSKMILLFQYDTVRSRSISKQIIDLQGDRIFSADGNGTKPA
jgi:hypothetical protein